MRLSDLQTKDIVSIKDGKRIGRIIDVEINNADGKIVYLIIEPKRTFRTFTSGGTDTNISFNQIVKIGEDVILVDL